MRKWPPDMRSQQLLVDNPLIKCPCGRLANADMMRDVRDVKGILGTDADYICDSCMERHHRTETLSREDYYRAVGAPQGLVAKVAKRERAIRALRGEQT